MTRNDKWKHLSPKQRAAIPFFLGYASVEEACREAGISRNTYYEWMKEPLFKAELTRLQEEVFLEATGGLKLNAVKAVSVLCSLMDREDHPNVQRAAANDVLNHVLKFKELLEIEQRLMNLENNNNKI